MAERIKVTNVDRSTIPPRSVEIEILGTYIKFLKIHGKLVEASRVRDSQIYDRPNYYINREDYLSAVRRAAAILG